MTTVLFPLTFDAATVSVLLAPWWWSWHVESPADSEMPGRRAGQPAWSTVDVRDVCGSGDQGLRPGNATDLPHAPIPVTFSGHPDGC
ncbi:MAG: hypothetical protein ACR2GH_06660 [Pseudonocardia sp.]